MARVNKRRAKKRAEMRAEKKKKLRKTVPKLVNMLPHKGVRWLSGRQKLFLTGRQSSAIVHGLRASLNQRIIPEDHVAACFAKMFEKAMEHLDQCATMEPVAFWTAIRNEVPWLKHEPRMDGETAYALSILILSARFFCTNDANDWKDIGAISPLAAQDMKADTRLTRAVDAFKYAVFEKYEAGSDTRQKYVPRFTQETHNMGSQEATDEMWKKICKGEYKVSDFNHGAVEYWGIVDFSDHEEEAGEDNAADNNSNNGEEEDENNDAGGMDWEPAEPQDPAPTTSNMFANLTLRPKEQ